MDLVKVLQNGEKKEDTKLAPLLLNIYNYLLIQGEDQQKQLMIIF